WKEFIKRKKCLYCSKKYEATKHNPYCDKCTGNFVEYKLNINMCEEIYISDEGIKTLEENLSWLSEFKNKYKSTDLCTICGSNYDAKAANLKKFINKNSFLKYVLQHTK